MVIRMAKGQRSHPEAHAVIFNTEVGAKSWRRMALVDKPEKMLT